jgi:molybdopterin molybdotransferase
MAGSDADRHQSMTVRQARTISSEELEAPLLAYSEALRRTIDSFPSLVPVETPLGKALGLALACDVVAEDDIPSFDNSAMDGYAVRSIDLAECSNRTPVTLAVADAMAPGASVRVMTGFPIPQGADAVIPWESVSVAAPRVSSDRQVRSITAQTPVTPGAFVRARGGDVCDGDLVLRKGRTIGAAEIGMLATLGHSTIMAHPRPRIGVLSTGDELVGIEQPLSVGKVRNSNGPMLAAACTALGAVVTSIEYSGDDPVSIAASLERIAAHADLVVSTGGASVGEHDWVRTVLEGYAPLTFWRVSMRPGKPVALGRVGSVPALMLPGNPGSVLACTHVFVARAIRALGGRETEPLEVRAELTHAIDGDPTRTVVHPVQLDGASARPASFRSSNALSTALGATGWVIVPPGGVPAGSTVAVEIDL